MRGSIESSPATGDPTYLNSISTPAGLSPRHPVQLLPRSSSDDSCRLGPFHLVCVQKRSDDSVRPTNGMDMTNSPLDELGPVDYVVVEFPAGASTFTGEMASELRKLVEGGIIRIIDVLILTKEADGTVDAIELSDVDELGDLQQIETELAELLAAEDVEHLAAAMEPGSTAGVLIWENLWAAPFASAARRSGGQLIADGRIPIQAILASIEADEPPAA
jgi:Family of unknown function (DUF6325)